MTRRILLLAAFLLLPAVVYSEPPAGNVLSLAREWPDSAYAYAEKNGAQIEETSDGISFTAWWHPENFDPKTGIVLVSLPGHQGWATRDFSVWHKKKILQQRGYAYLGIQWWYGRSTESVGYAKPDSMYRWIVEGLERHGIPKGHVIFTGFSRGGANVYPVTARDHSSGNDYFAVTIANAGAMEANYPPVREMFEGRYGKKPLAGTKWLLYCSLNDEQRERACEKMAQTKQWLEDFGAEVPLFIQDSVGQHGGFMAPSMHNQFLDLAEEIVKKVRGVFAK